MSETKEVEVLEKEIPLPTIVENNEINQQVATAHRYPRSITKFRQEAMTMATIDEETAASCFYKLPRAGKEIEGPGIRLAEIVASAWGNLRTGARIVEETNEYIVAQGFAHDLEKNVATAIEVRRRITDKYGKKYSSDMVSTTANAACSIALRNAIFKVIPKSYIDKVYESAKSVAIGNASTLNSRRTAAIAYFSKMGVTEAQILSTLGKAGIQDIDLNDIETLTGLKTAIKDGQTTVDQAFPPLQNSTTIVSNTSKTQSVTDKVKQASREPGSEG